MSFLKQLLTPFVEFDEPPQKEPPKAAPQQAGPVQQPPKPAPVQATDPTEHPLITGTPAPPPAARPPLPAYSPGGTLTQPLPEHEQYFEQLVDKANRTNPLFQGTDFKEFIDSKVDIDDIADENLRYRTAFNVLKSTGLTREKLLSTGQEYLDIIGRDLNAFQGAHAQQYKKEVGGKEALVQKKAEELQALTQRINALKGEINALTQDIEVVREKLNTTKASFLLAGENKQAQIQMELQKILQYF